MHVTLRAARTSILLLAVCSDMMQPMMNKHAGSKYSTLGKGTLAVAPLNTSRMHACMFCMLTNDESQDFTNVFPAPRPSMAASVHILRPYA
eukprot:254072-Pelagomonas_calceolata.AAC.1